MNSLKNPDFTVQHKKNPTMFRQGSARRNFLKFSPRNGEKRSRPGRETPPSWYEILGQYVPFILACAVLLSIISLNSASLIFGLLVSILMVVFIQQIGQRMHISPPWLLLIQILVAAVILSGFWLDYSAAPAQAQFFKKAEDFFQNTLTQGSTTTDNTRTAVSLVFNVLRAIYLLYIAGSLIGVINAVRKDEDWQSIARIPLLVVIAVTVADVLTGFIIGDTSK
jgi:heme A synthase